MKRSLWSAALLVAAAAVLAAPQRSKPKAPAQPATPRMENQFATVDEFVKARRSARTPVSVEGYAVIGWRAGDGSVRMALTDSVDHVLSTKDADGAARAGASATAPSSAVKSHPGWAWSAKGLQRVAMYAGTGAGRAQKQLHDTVARIRVTGLANGRAISPVTRIDYTDDNGEWKKL